MCLLKCEKNENKMILKQKTYITNTFNKPVNSSLTTTNSSVPE